MYLGHLLLALYILCGILAESILERTELNSRSSKLKLRFWALTVSLLWPVILVVSSVKNGDYDLDDIKQLYKDIWSTLKTGEV